MNILNSADTAATINLITRNARGTTTTSDGATSAGLTAKENLSHLISGGFDMPHPASIFEGVPPFSFISNGNPLVNWIIYGNTVEGISVGEKTSNILGVNFENGYYLSSSTGLPTAYTGYCAITNPVDVTNYENVTFSFTTSKENVHFMYSILDNGVLVERRGSKNSGDIINVESGDTLYLCIYISGSIPITTTDFNEEMLCEGSTTKPYEPYNMYKIPVVCGGVTTNIYIDEPLTAGETISYNDTGVIIPTTMFLNTLSVDTTVQPEKVFIEYVK